MKVAIGIPTYSGAERLRALLQSIRKWTNPVYPICVLDDGSPPIELRLIREVCHESNVALMIHDENMGISRSWNDLTKHFDSDIMVLLNDDVLVAEDWLKAIVYFLENNECGSVSLPFYFIEPEDVQAILTGGEWTPRDPMSKHPAPEKLNEIRETMTPGVLMCPAGNIFAFKREKYDAVDGFDTRFKSFFEESDFGTKLAEMGFKTYGLTYPVCWHVWSQTFRENPELEAGKVLTRSHLAYCEKWEVPMEYFDEPFNYTNPKFMKRIPKQKVKWIGNNDKEYEAWDQ